MSNPKHAGGRPRKGTLEFRGKTWHARLTVTVDGESLRKWFDLGTDNKAAARRKLARLSKEQAASPRSPAEIAVLARRTETVAELAEAYVARRKLEGVKTWSDEARWLRIDVIPMIGEMPVDQVRHVHIRELLDQARERGRGEQSLIHIRGVAGRLFTRPFDDEVISENPVTRVKLRHLREVKRERAILTDAEFVRFVTCALVDVELRVMAVVARVVGGMRTGDVHAWTWESIDLVAFESCRVPRVKTGQPQKLFLPEVGKEVLRAWWSENGKPASGPVFPVRRGRRAGQHKRKGSHAERLRKALLVAGVERPEVHVDTPTSLRADFHSFRRAFSTSLADAGVNAQLGSRLAGHASLSAHERYLMQSVAMQTIPEAAVPQFSFATGRAETWPGQMPDSAEIPLLLAPTKGEWAGCLGRPIQ